MMLGLKDTWHVRYTGDAAAGRALLPFAMRQATILKEESSFSNIVSNRRTVPIPRLGALLTVVKVGAHYNIWIHVTKALEKDTAVPVVLSELFQILLTNYVLARAYNYYDNTLHVAIISADNTSTVALSSLYNGRSQLGDATRITYKDGWSSEVLGNDRAFLGGLNRYELAVFASGNAIYGRVGDLVGHIATVPGIFLPDFAKPYGSLFSLPAYKALPVWNQFQGIIQYTLSPATLSLQDSWYWTPSFFTAQPADSMGFQPGFYYGKYPNQLYGEAFVDLESAKVSFKGLLETKHTSGDYQYGWCEIVKEVNGVAVNDLNFYFQSSPLTVPGNPTFGYLRIAGTTADQTITTGSDLPGFNRALSLAADTSTAEVSMWNFQIWASSGQDSGVCIVQVDGSVASFKRFSGFLLPVYQTTTYHSHSVSSDGTILAVFESDDGVLIHRVRVFDLFGTREAKDGAEYTAGGFTELQASDTVASVEALTGCLINYRAADFEPAVLPYDLGAATPSAAPADYTDYLPALGIVRFNKRADGAPEIKKLVCYNGVDAEYSISIDHCFDSTMVVEHSYSPAEEKLVGLWDGGIPGGTLEGKLRGNFVGAHPSMRFQGVGDGWYTSTRIPEFTITAHIDGSFTFSGYLGDLIYGAGFDADGAPDPDSAATSCSPIGKTYTASSSCGQTAEYTELADPFTMSGTSTPVVGSQYSAGGGVAPYSYSFDGGGISGTGVITSVTSCPTPGDPRWATVSATDACGQVASIVVRLPGGVWAADGPFLGFAGDCSWFDVCGPSSWYVGGIRIDGRVSCIFNDAFCSYIPSGAPYSAGSFCGCASPRLPDWRTYQQYEWRCP